MSEVDTLCEEIPLSLSLIHAVVIKVLHGLCHHNAPEFIFVSKLESLFGQCVKQRLKVGSGALEIIQGSICFPAFFAGVILNWLKEHLHVIEHLVNNGVDLILGQSPILLEVGGSHALEDEFLHSLNQRCIDGCCCIHSL